jgi:hypothetical protein
MEFKNPGFTIITGPCGQGKSHLIRWIMRKQKRVFDYVVVFCQTSFGADSFDYIDKKYIHPAYSEKILRNVMNIQKKLVKRSATSGAGKDKKVMVIFDDCLDRRAFRSQIFQDFVTQYRHYNASLIISTQYPNLLTTTMRSNCFKSITFRVSTNVALKALHESYGQEFDFSDFKEKVLALPKYHFIIFDTIGGGNKVMTAPAKIPRFEIKVNNKI